MRNIVSFVVGIVIAVCFVGCGRVGAVRHDDVVASGVRNLPEVGQITNVLRKFPIHHRITHFNLDKEKPKRWNTLVYLHDRYTFQYSIYVAINYDTGNVIGSTGPSDFFLRETIGLSAEGNEVIGDQWRFDSNSWSKIYAAGGDFSAIGIILKTNAPIPNWSELISIK